MVITTCIYCLQHGDGKKWYLNPKNYSDEIIKSSLVAEAGIIEMLGGPAKMNLELGSAMQVDKVIKDIKNQEQIKTVNMLVERTHGGQVVPIEDALKILDLTRGYILVPCYCRKHFGGLGDRMTCLFLYPVNEMVPETRPWEQFIQLTKEEAREKLLEFDKEGYVHGVYWAPVPVPVVICNCAYPYCIGLKFREDYKVENAARKAHYIGAVDPDKCDGCKNKDAPLCFPRCQFGAIRWNVELSKALIDPRACFGCGLCRVTCPTHAITLHDREEWPALKDDY